MFWNKPLRMTNAQCQIAVLRAEIKHLQELMEEDHQRYLGLMSITKAYGTHMGKLAVQLRELGVEPIPYVRSTAEH